MLHTANQLLLKRYREWKPSDLGKKKLEILLFDSVMLTLRSINAQSAQGQIVLNPTQARRKTIQSVIMKAANKR